MPMFQKIFGPARIDSGSGGGSQDFALTPRAVGRRAKTAQYSVVVLQKSGSNAQVGMRLDHGPDGVHFATHSTPIATQAVPTSNLIVGGADDTEMLNEFLRSVIVASSADANPQWLVVELYEMLKEF